jgi:hypothetical protein
MESYGDDLGGEYVEWPLVAIPAQSDEVTKIFEKLIAERTKVN